MDVRAASSSLEVTERHREQRRIVATCSSKKVAHATARASFSSSVLDQRSKRTPLRNAAHIIEAMPEIDHATGSEIAADAIERAKKIRVIVFDVDGVLTDGQIILVPDPKSRTADDPVGSGVEVKGFAAHDGLGIILARLGGLKLGIITKRQSQTVALRARDLKIEYVFQGQNHKLSAAKQIAAQAGITLEQMAYVGDDVVDLSVMRVCGLAIATANARPQVKAAAQMVTKMSGGQGAGRDAIDFILEAQGSLDHAIEQFLNQDDPAAASADIGSGNM